jgi:hypothetical protein
MAVPPHKFGLLEAVGRFLAIFAPLFLLSSLLAFAWSPLDVAPPFKKWSSYSQLEKRTIGVLLLVLIGIFLYAGLRPHAQGH